MNDFVVGDVVELVVAAWAAEGAEETTDPFALHAAPAAAVSLAAEPTFLSLSATSTTKITFIYLHNIRLVSDLLYDFIYALSQSMLNLRVYFKKLVKKKYVNFQSSSSGSALFC